MAPSSKSKDVQRGDAELLTKLKEMREKESSHVDMEMNRPDDEFKKKKDGKANFAQDEVKFMMGSSKPE
jgi:hypothetical protein